MTVLNLPGCPSWRTALERVHLTADRTGIQLHVTTQTVESDEDVPRLGFTGSPTILIGGQDPFSRAGSVPALACRVDATPNGPAGAPTIGQPVDALGRAAERAC